MIAKKINNFNKIIFPLFDTEYDFFDNTFIKILNSTTNTIHFWKNQVYL